MGRCFFCKVFLAGSMIAPPPWKFSGCHECGLLTDNPRISPKQGFSWLMSQQSISDFLCNHFALVVWFLEGGEINTTVFKKCCCFVITLGSCLLLKNGELFHFRVEEPQ